MLCVLSVMAHAASIRVIPPGGALKGRSFNVIFRVENGSKIDVKSAPRISGCRELAGPVQVGHSGGTVIINGRTVESSSTTDIAWTYMTEESGDYTVSSAAFLVDGKQITTKPVQFSVLNSPAPDPVNVMASAPSQDDVLVRIVLNKSTAYEQEAIECTIKLYTQFPITEFFPTLQPNYEGFLIDEVEIRNPTINQREQVNGKTYYSAVLKKCIIFPQKSGKLTINSGEYDVTVEKLDRIAMDRWAQLFDPRSQKLKIKSNSASIEIKPLPEPRPAGFTNAVGDFRIESHLASDKFSTGQTGSLIYTITGTGNIKYLKEPDVKFPSEFDTYDVRSKFDGGVNGSTVSGTMTFDYTFTPNTVGQFTIPGEDFVYFNPSTGEYKTLKTGAYTLNVAQGEETGDVNTSHLTDILPINVEAQGGTPTYIVNTWWYWMLYFIVFITLIVTLYLYRKRIEMIHDVKGMKIARAEKTARNRLKIAQGLMSAGKSEQFYASILEALFGYIGDKLSMPASQLSRENISEALSSHGADTAAVNKVIELIDMCETARYTPGGSSADQMHHVYDDTSAVIAKLESLNKK